MLRVTDAINAARARGASLFHFAEFLRVPCLEQQSARSFMSWAPAANNSLQLSNPATMTASRMAPLPPGGAPQKTAAEVLGVAYFGGEPGTFSFVDPDFSLGEAAASSWRIVLDSDTDRLPDVPAVCRVVAASLPLANVCVLQDDQQLLAYIGGRKPGRDTTSIL